MSMNKFMHPKNPYRTPPNFKQLAIDYPAFRNFAKTDLSGKVVIDFKDQETLRSLAVTLLHNDFNLQVEIPLDRLIPTIPLRLNYLLWIEDLLEEGKINENVHGVDIGTGASCVYPLLASKRKQWKMLATELNEESASCANRNVTNNNLESLITVKKVDATQLLIGVLDENTKYSFSMCNPPFFKNEEERDSLSKARSPSRTPPSNAPSGSKTEVVVEGGEVNFVKRMINESKQLKDKISIYTSMLGHKKSVNILLQEIAKSGVTSFSKTEFCQGHTTRWGIAWTFCPNIKFSSLSNKVVVTKKLQAPMEYIIPSDLSDTEYTVDGIMDKVKLLLDDLKMRYTRTKETKLLIAMEVKAFENTWSHQRKKKRQQEKMSTSNGSMEDEPTNKKPCSETDVTFNDVPLIEFQLSIEKIADFINLYLIWCGGTTGRETLHQIFQYFKNKLKS